MTSQRIQPGNILSAVLLLAAVVPAISAFAEEDKIFIAVFDFSAPSKDGSALADSVRLKLARRDDSMTVIDTQSMQNMSLASPDINATDKTLQNLLDEQVGAHVCIFGTLKNAGEKYIAVVRIFDGRPNELKNRKYIFEDDSQRWRAVIAEKIVHAMTGKAAEIPPQYGDDAFPPAEELEGPLNANSSFDVVPFTGWEPPDNLACFIASRSDGGGKMLRIRTDIDRDEWLAYRKALLAGQASPDSPPRVKSAGKTNLLASMEGAHYKSDFLPADVNAVYWLRASYRFVPANGYGASAEPMIFVKGFRATPAAFDGLPESTLKKLKMTPADFSALTPEQRQKLIEADVRQNPQKYLRECYRWHMVCPATSNWSTQAAKFPPRGKLPPNVQFLQIQIHAYWPPGEYFWDNVELYRQKCASSNAKGSSKCSTENLDKPGKNSQ